MARRSPSLGGPPLEGPSDSFARRVYRPSGGPPTMTAMNIPLLKTLSEAPGVPGREERVRAILQREAQGLFDAVTTDPMGNLIATKRGKGGDGAPRPKRVLLACHMDEIGFYVRHVDDK